MVDGFVVFLGKQRYFVTWFITTITNTTSGGIFLMQCFLLSNPIDKKLRLQRIFTSHNVGRYHNIRREGNHVTSMARQILQTKGLLLFVTETTSSQTFRLGSVETKFETNDTKHNQSTLKVSARQVGKRSPLPLEMVLLHHYQSVICQTWPSLHKLRYDKSRFQTQ